MLARAGDSFGIEGSSAFYTTSESFASPSPVHAILECFSVLTRLPAPYRSLPETVKLVLERTLSRTAVIPALGPEGVWSAIDMLSRLGLGGGRVYDAAIAQCVSDAGATVLLTWNTKHFLPIARAGLDVKEP